MSRQATHEYLQRMKSRYAAMRTRKAKTKILDEFVAAAGNAGFVTLQTRCINYINGLIEPTLHMYVNVKRKDDIW